MLIEQPHLYSLLHQQCCFATCSMEIVCPSKPVLYIQLPVCCHTTMILLAYKHLILLPTRCIRVGVTRACDMQCRDWWTCACYVPHSCNMIQCSGLATFCPHLIISCTFVFFIYCAALWYAIPPLSSLYWRDSAHVLAGYGEALLQCFCACFVLAITTCVPTDPFTTYQAVCMAAHVSQGV
jgi:hypothetical protein